MDVVKIGQITNADVYFNDNLLVGRFKELNFPDVESTEVKHETLGQIAVLNLPGRPLKELKGKAVVQFLDKDLLRSIYVPNRAVKLTTHHFVDVFDQEGINVSKGHRIVSHLTAMFRKAGGKAMKLGDNIEGEFDLTFLSFTQTVSDESVPLIEVDVMAQIYNINGVPVWSKY